jgi:hypothetical protein
VLLPFEGSLVAQIPVYECKTIAANTRADAYLAMALSAYDPLKYASTPYVPMNRRAYLHMWVFPIIDRINYPYEHIPIKHYQTLSI